MTKTRSLIEEDTVTQGSTKLDPLIPTNFSHRKVFSTLCLVGVGAGGGCAELDTFCLVQLQPLIPAAIQFLDSGLFV